MQNPLFTLIVQKTGRDRYKVIQIRWDGQTKTILKYATWNDLLKSGYISRESLEWLL